MISSYSHQATNDQLLPEKIQNRLQNLEIADGLTRLLDRIDSIAFAVEAFEGFISRGDTIVESLEGVTRVRR